MSIREMEIREESRAEGREEGRAEGRVEGMNLLSQVYAKLFSLGRTEDVMKAATDAIYRDRLFKEFGII